MQTTEKQLNIKDKFNLQENYFTSSKKLPKYNKQSLIK